LELLVNQYLDFAELQARQGKIMYMVGWKAKLDSFLKLNDRDILTSAGKISAEMAKELATAEYDKFVERRMMIEADRVDEELRKAIRMLTGGEDK
jgi:hypothetical protein